MEQAPNRKGTKIMFCYSVFLPSSLLRTKSIDVEELKISRQKTIGDIILLIGLPFQKYREYVICDSFAFCVSQGSVATYE